MQYTPIIHPFSHVEDDVLSASQRLIWSNFRCDGTRSVRTSEAVTLHFFLWSQPFASALEAEIEKEVLCIHHRRLAWYYTYYCSIRSSRQKAILDSYFQRCRFDFQSQVHVSRQTGMFSKWKNILQLLLFDFDGIATQRKETNSRCIDSHFFKGEISKDVALPWSNLRQQPCLIFLQKHQSHQPTNDHYH